MYHLVCLLITWGQRDFYRNISSMLLWLFCKVNTEYLLCVCLVWKITHGLWQSRFILTGFSCWNVQIIMPLIWSRIKLLLNESFIPRARISKRMTSTFPNAVEIRPVPVCVCPALYFYQINYFIIFFSDLFWGEFFPYYFTSFNRKELGRVHLCM